MSAEQEDLTGLEAYDAKKHKLGVLLLTALAFSFPGFIVALLLALESGLYGVVQTDERGVTGFFLGKADTTLGGKRVADLHIVAVAKRARGARLASRMGAYMMSGAHPTFRHDAYDEVLIADTDVWNSPSWLWSDRLGVRYFTYAEQLRLFGVIGFLKMHLTWVHSVQGLFMKRLCRTPAEAAASDAAQRDRGLVDLVLAGILPATYWALHFVYACSGAVDPISVGYAYAATYALLVSRWAAAHVLAPPEGVAFRAYDAWINPLAASGCPVYAVLLGEPFLGWCGGFYIRAPGVNYARPEIARRLGLMHIGPNAVSLCCFAAHTALRVAAPRALIDWLFLDFLGVAAFFFTITDVAMFFLSFPSGGAAMRRWHPLAYICPCAAWIALVVVTLVLPGPDAPPFAQAAPGACRAAQ
jgi:hypothetical protein